MPYLKTTTEEDLIKTDYLQRGAKCKPLYNLGYNQRKAKEKKCEVKVLVAQSCPTLCDPMNCSLPYASLSLKFSRQEYWNGYPFPSQGYLFHPGIQPRSPALQADCLSSEPSGKSQANSKWSLLLQSPMFFLRHPIHHSCHKILLTHIYLLLKIKTAYQRMYYNSSF